MTAPPQTPSGLPEVVMDGEPLEVSAENGAARQLQQLIESVALRRNRVISSLFVDGLPVPGANELPLDQAFQLIEVETVSFEELSTQLVVDARAAIERLKAELDFGQLTVLINDPLPNHQLWQKWQFDLQGVLSSLAWLRELWGGEFVAHDRAVPSLNNRLKALERITCEIELLLAGKISGAQVPEMRLSDIIERLLIPWLDNIERFLDDFHELRL